MDVAGLRSERFFHLAGEPVGGRARLLDGDARHALRVLRVHVGDELVGGDGRGRAWPLRVVSAGRGGLELEVAGPAWSTPAAGEPGSRAPRVVVALALPRGGRSESCLERMTQLGVWAVHPLASERVQGHRREPGEARSERCQRVLREACKPARRLWTPEFGAPLGLDELARGAGPGRTLLLDPEAPRDLLGWAAANPGSGAAERPLTVVVGPEGGLTREERAALERAGAVAVRLGPHVLRIETAAEAAVSLLVLALASAFA